MAGCRFRLADFGDYRMKKYPFLKKALVGTTALAALLYFNACSDKSAVDDEDDESDVIELSASGKSSSSAKPQSSSVPELSDILTDVDQEKLLESISLSAPTNVGMTRLAPSVFQLSWRVEGSANALTGFVVQRLAPSSTEWENVGALSSTVTHLVIDGSNNIDYYYRIASYYGESRSAYTDEVLVSRGTAYQSDLEFPVVPEVVANIDRDSLLEFVLTGNYPSQAVEHSIYNYDSAGTKKGDVYYEARFVYGSSYSIDTVKFSMDQGAVSKKFKSLDDQCNAFGQVRVVWKDKNGSKDYGDWTSPIGTKTGTTDGLKGDINARCGEVAVVENGFAVPTDVKAVQVSSVWMLEWSYTEFTDHPAAGFIVQKLNLKDSKWEDVGKTGKGVTRYSVGLPTDEYSYYRVAAIDDKKERSSYSADVLITVSNAESALAVPAMTGATEYSDTKMALAWTFEDNVNRPIKGFIIETLNLKTNKWTAVDTVGPEVNKFLIDVASTVRYVRVVAYDAKAKSASADMVIPANATSVLLLPSPTNLAYKELSGTELSLTWSYEANDKRPAKGFVIELLDLDKDTWNNVGKVSSAVKVFKVKTADDARYYRVGAYDATDTLYSDYLFVPANTRDASEALLATPSMAQPTILSSGKISLSWTYEDSPARPAKSMDLQLFSDGAWSKVKTVGLNTSRYTVDAVDYDRYYRVVAYDSKDSSFSNDVLVAAKSASVGAQLSAPVVTGVSEISMESRSLAWNYTANGERIAEGFVIQSLDMTNNKWVQEGSVSKDIRRFTIGVGEDVSYWRVGAYDASDTVFSVDFMVAGIVYELPAPTNPSYRVQDNGSVVLTWNYTMSKNRPADYFRIDVIDFINQAWTTKVAKVPVDVHYQSISASDQALYYRIVAVDSKDEAATEGFLVEATVPAAGILPAPSGVSGSVLANGKVRLNWSYSGNSKLPVAKFIPEWSENSVDWNSSTTKLDSTVRTAVVVGPTKAQGGLYYRVAAEGTKGEKNYSVAIYVDYADVSVDLPVPSNLSATMLSDSTYTLTWSFTDNKSRPVDHFELQKLSDANTWMPEVANIAKDARRISVAKSGEKDRFYRIVAVDANGEAYSNDVRIEGVVNITCEMATPTGLSGKMLANGNVEVSWSYVANDKCPATEFAIQNYISGAFTDVEVVGKNFRTYEFKETDASFEKNGYMYYRVVAMDGDQERESDAIKVAFEKVRYDLPAPTNVTSENISNNRVSIKWEYTEEVSRPAVKFIVYRFEESAGDFVWTKVTETDAKTRIFVTSAETVDYYFRVSAVDKDDNESFSSEVLVAGIENAVSKLAAPTEFAYTVDEEKYVVSWGYAQNEEYQADKFVLMKSTDGNNWEQFKTASSKAVVLGMNMRSYVFDDRPLAGYYSLWAVNTANEDSAASEAIYISMYNVDFNLTAPTGVSYAARDDGKFEISWNYEQGTVSAESFSIETCTDGKFGSNKNVFQSGLDISLRTFVFAAPTEALYYRVVAVATDYDNANSEAIYIASNEDEKVLNAPVLNTVVDMSRADGKYAITWTYEQGTLNALSFEIRTSDDGNNWSSAAVATLDPSVTTYVFDAPDDGMYYRVEAVNGDSKKVSNAIYISGYTVDLTLPSPSGLTAFRLSPSVWVLQWEYISEPKRPELGFRLQQSKVSETADGAWSETAQVEPNVLQYYVLGQENRENFYRVAAFDGENAGTKCSYITAESKWSDGCKFSDYSGTIQITESTPYREDLNFSTAPALNVKGVSDLDAGGAALSATVYIAVTDDQIAKSISALPYTSKVEYEFRVVTSDGGQVEGETTIKLYTGDGSAAMIKVFDDRDAACHTANDTYVQVRGKWTEAATLEGKTLGGVAYTEWSNLVRLGDQVTGCDKAPAGSEP